MIIKIKWEGDLIRGKPKRKKNNAKSQIRVSLNEHSWNCKTPNSNGCI